MVQISLTVYSVRSSGFSRVTTPCTGLKPLLRTVKLKPPLLNHALPQKARCHAERSEASRLGFFAALSVT